MIQFRLTERLYTGQRWDWQAQLYDYGARLYDPKVASFLTEDPVSEYVSSYAYVGWNPVRRTDPTGMFSSLASGQYFSIGGSAFANWYASWSGGFAQGFGGFGGFSGIGSYLSYSATNFDESFSLGGVRIGGLEAGVGSGVASSFASSVADFGMRFSTGGVQLSGSQAGALAGAISAFSVQAGTIGSLVPSSAGGLFALPVTLLASLLFFAFSGFNSPQQLTVGGTSALLFSGNPLGFLTLGHAIWGDAIASGYLQAHGYPTLTDAATLAHEFGHVSQFSALGPAFLGVYLAQVPAAALVGTATANLFAVVQFNVLENFFLNGAPSAYDLAE